MVTDTSAFTLIHYRTAGEEGGGERGRGRGEGGGEGMKGRDK